MKDLSIKAFTLIELLIVISIVSLLSTVIMYSVSGAKIGAQDTHKKEEVRQVNNALAIYKDKNSDTPRGLNAGTSASFGVVYNENTPEYQSAMQTLVDAKALPEIPTSPNGVDYFYLVEEEGEGVFGAVLRSNNEISDNNGCEFSNDNYGCSGPAKAYVIEFNRDSLTQNSEDCLSGECDGVGSGGGSQLTTEDSCFIFSTGSITGYDDVNCPSDVIVPSTINGEFVTSIGDYAFQSKQLTSIVFPDSLISIGNWAFQNNQLTSVVFPDSVTSIGHISFSSNQLTSVTIPETVSFIGNGAFTSNYLTSVTIPSNNTSIGNFTFQNNQLTSVIIPDSVTSIGSGAFQSNYLTSVTIGNNVSTISSTAFRHNQLTSVYIPDSVTSISGYAFWNNGINSININSETSYAYNAFPNGCTVASGCISER